MNCTAVGSTSTASPEPSAARARTASSANRLSGPSGALAWAIVTPRSSSAVRYSTSSVTRPPTTLRYGVSMKPNGLIRP
jgi:hypothetical protein